MLHCRPVCVPLMEMSALRKKKKEEINRNVSYFFKKGHKFGVKIILAKPQREMSGREEKKKKKRFKEKIAD